MSRILVIDDETLYHKMIAHALEAEKYQLDFASSDPAGIGQRLPGAARASSHHDPLRC